MTRPVLFAPSRPASASVGTRARRASVERQEFVLRRLARVDDDVDELGAVYDRHRADLGGLRFELHAEVRLFLRADPDVADGLEAAHVRGPFRFTVSAA